jgi:hypothetical protein
MANTDKTAKPGPAHVAPGYPAPDGLRAIDVTGYEPAAVFHPVELEPKAEQGGKK